MIEVKVLHLVGWFDLCQDHVSYYLQPEGHVAKIVQVLQKISTLETFFADE